MYVYVSGPDTDIKNNVIVYNTDKQDKHVIKGYFHSLYLHCYYFYVL